MNNTIERERVDEALGSIRNALSEAYKSLGTWGTGAADDKEVVNYYVEEAFVQTMVLLEALGLSETLGAVRVLNDKAKANYSKAAMGPDDLYLVWASKLGQYVEAIENVMGGTKSGAVTKDLVEILRATQYSITDTKCFQSTPSREEEVHVRVEAVLRCVFSDVRTKPPIAKPIKNFVPDTGIPSLSTLLEYKFISTNEEAKRVAEEVLADTRGYVSRDWNRFIYVIYETRRIKPEREWNDLLKSCGAAENTTAIVISGEPAGVKYARVGRLKKSKRREPRASRKR